MNSKDQNTYKGIFESFLKNIKIGQNTLPNFKIITIDSELVILNCVKKFFPN